MKALTIPDRENMILALQDEIRRSECARYDHRLHGVLLVAQGHTCPEVGRMLGDSARAVEYWVRRFDSRGLAGLQEGERSGRPRRLTEEQMSRVAEALRRTPVECGMEGAGLWDGKTLSAYLHKGFGVSLRVRQCQRLFRQLRFRLRKPRPVIARARPEEQAAYKKTPGLGSGPERRRMGDG